MFSEAKLLANLEGHQDRVWSVAWNASGTTLASCGGDKTVRLWAEEGGRWICKTVLEGSHRRTIRCVCWSPCGRFLATSSFDGTTCIWTSKSGDFECIATLEGHENEVKSVSWSCSGSLLATCSRDKSVWIWEVDGDGEEFECASVLNSHSQDVKQVKWHPSEEIKQIIGPSHCSKLLVSASYDDTIKIYTEDTDDWVCSGSLESHSSTVWSIDFDKTGDRLASCSDDRTVKIWQRYRPGNSQGVSTTGKQSTWKCVCTISGYHSRPVYHINWCKLTGLIATACGDDAVRVFREDLSVGDANQPTFELVSTIHKAHSQEVNCVAWNPTQAGLLASCSDYGDVKLWNINIPS